MHRSNRQVPFPITFYQLFYLYLQAMANMDGIVTAIASYPLTVERPVPMGLHQELQSPVSQDSGLRCGSIS